MESRIRIDGITYAVSNTGPLISAFQSESFVLLSSVFPLIYITPVVVSELEKHGWREEVQVESSLVIENLTSSEEQQALRIAQQITQHPRMTDHVVENHLGEAQAIILSLRREHQDDVLLIDELAARAVGQQMGRTLSGFPGVLLLAMQAGLISAEDVKAKLETCRLKGTHYSSAFIQQVYDSARRSRR